MRITGNKPISGVQGRGAKKSVSSSGDQFAPDLGGEVSQSSQTAGPDVLGQRWRRDLPRLADQP